MKNYLKKENFYILIAFFVLLLFGYITWCTPLAGDDWGYYLNGISGNPIKTAIDFYNGWSGRFFSELWGMIIPSHKWLWNIINPLLFTLIYIFLYKLSDIKNKPILNTLLIIVLMLSVEENVRMETYTWIMGTTYIVPLCFSLIYLYSINCAFKEKGNKGLYLNNILLFISCLMMENISGTLVGTIFIIGLYAYFKDKRLVKYLIINFIVALSAFVIMRVSPGSTYRTLNDHADWMALSLAEKIITAYPNFIQITFLNNRYLIVILSMTMIGFIIFKSQNKNKIVKILSLIVYFLSIVIMCSYYLHIDGNILQECSSVFSFVFWPIYIFTILFNLFLFSDKGYQRDKTIVLFIVGGTCALVMLYSPIYGSRSVIYTIYYLIAVIISIFDSYELPKELLNKILVVLFIGFICIRGRLYISKYTSARYAQIERESIIQYYIEHPESEEVWIPRFPINTLHSIDVDPGDTYHFEVFKEYYHLPQDVDKIFFYWKEEY